MPRVADLTPEQHEEVKKRDRERHAAKREKERLERERQEPLEYDQACEAFDRSPEAKQLNQYQNDTMNKIFEELQISDQVSAAISEALDRVLSLHYCFDHTLAQQTDRGAIYGGYSAEVSGEDIVRWRHQLDLTRSKSFSDVYWNLVRKLEKMYGSNLTSKDACYRTSAQAIKDELSGTYVYPPPQPAPKVVPIPEPPVPEPDTDLELKKVLDRKRQQLEDDLARYGQINQLIGPDAMKYLNDGRFR